MASVRLPAERVLALVLAVWSAFLLVLLVGAGIRSYLLIQPPPPLEAGQAAAAVTLPVSAEPGMVIDTGRLQGRAYLLTLWSESCTDCTDSLQLANRYQEEFRDRGFVALVVNEDDYLGAFRSRGIAAQHAPATLRLEDVSGVVRHTFALPPAHDWVLIGRSGRVVAFGPSPGPSRAQVALALAP